MNTERAGISRNFTPWLTRSLVAANVAVFAFMAARGVDMLHPDGVVWMHWGSNFAPLTVHGQWWRLLSAIFLHFGPLHLLFNMWALWVVGGPVEQLFGRTRYALVYLLAGLIGGIASVAWNPLVNSAGASGAIFGVIGAQLGFFVRGGHMVPREVIRRQRNSTLAFIAYSIFFGFMSKGIDNAAHVGGLVSGFAFGWLLARPLGTLARPSRDRMVLLLACLLGAAVIGGGGLLARQRAAAHAAEQAYLRDWQDFAAREDRVLKGMRQVMGQAREGKVDDGVVIAWLEGTGVPFYRDAAQHFAADTLPAGSPLAGDRANVLATARRRAAALQLMADGFRDRDRHKLDRALQEMNATSARPAGK